MRIYPLRLIISANLRVVGACQATCSGSHHLRHWGPFRIRRVGPIDLPGPSPLAGPSGLFLRQYGANFQKATAQEHLPHTNGNLRVNRLHKMNKTPCAMGSRLNNFLSRTNRFASMRAPLIAWQHVRCQRMGSSYTVAEPTGEAQESPGQFFYKVGVGLFLVHLCYFPLTAFSLL